MTTCSRDPSGVIASRTGVLMSIRRPDVRSISSMRSASSPCPRIVVVSSLRPITALNLRRAGSSLRGQVDVYVVRATALLSGVAALAMLDAERNAPDANITTLGDALWWAVTTITTVGLRGPLPHDD